jgi:dTDP-4-amino-4,6-dideoxygalactose transaminase
MTTLTPVPVDTPPVPFLDLGRVHAPLREQLDQTWHEVVEGSAFIGGKQVARFEAEFAAYLGVRHAIGVANGTDALHLTLRALGIGRGDEVILPANTFVATAEAVRLAGAQPRVVDVDEGTLLMEAEAFEDAIAARTAAVIPVHLYGQVADMAAIGAVAQRHGLTVIEDAAQAHGAAREGRRAGTFGVAGCFSFYPGKNLGALGDGGAIATDDDDLAERLRSISDHGRAPTSKHDHPHLGTNSRLDGLQAGLLAVKLPHLDGWNEQRRAVSARYRSRLAGEQVRFLDPVSDGLAVHHLEVVRVASRDRVRELLAADDIGAGIHYPVPVHQLDPYLDSASGPLPVTERAKDEILSLPMFPGMTDVEVERVVDAVARVVEEVCS